MVNKKMIKSVMKIKTACFYTFLLVFFFVGLLWFCRPSVSETEKRELTKFPEMTVSGVLDGSFWHGVDLWYSDTFPLREQLIECNGFIQSLYGDRSSQLIVDDGHHADDIPDIPTRPSGTDAPITDPGTDEPPMTDAPGTVEPPTTDAPGTDVPGTDTPGTDAPVTDAPVTDAPPDTGNNDPQEGEMKGNVYVSGDTGYRLYFFNRKNSEKFAEVINRAYDKYSGTCDIYCIIPPLNSILLNQATQDKLKISDQGRAIEYMYALMKEGVRTVDAYGSISAHKNEYIYFRTDHHWTALGAYYAYTAFAKSKGVTAHTLDMFERQEYPGFLGTGYSESQSQAMKNNPDTVIAYVPFGTNKMTMRQKDGKEVAWRVVNNVKNYHAGAKYACFAGGDQPYAYAHNPTITDGSACVLIKDSYGNAFVPFLIDHYEYVYWIDYRYYDGTLTALIKDKGIDDVIFCPNIYSTGVSSVINHLTALMP